MASLTQKPALSAGVRSTSASNSRVARFKPFSGRPQARQPAPRSVQLRAAEPEAEAAAAAAAPAEEDFAFNFSDAKKGNEYSANDVEAAMAFYAGEGGHASEVEAEHVTTPKEFSDAGVEDAAVFDEFDNNEAYDDEFVAAGIPEAAPKQRRAEREKEDGADEDQMEAAKATQQLKEAEEQMVLEAELQEMGLDQEVSQEGALVGPAVWDWMSDVAVDEEDDGEIQLMARNPARVSAAVASALPTDEQMFVDMRTTNLQDVDPETKETIEFLLDDFDIEGELKAIPDGEDNEELPEVPSLDLKAIDELLAADVSLPAGIDADLSLGDLPLVQDDGLDLDAGVVSKYVASLNAATGVEMDDSEVKALFGDQPITKLVPGKETAITTDDADLAEPAVAEMGNLEVPEITDDLEELDDVSDYMAELNSLRAMAEPTFEAPTDEEIEVLDQYLAASEQFLASEEARKEAIVQAVARGELSADALDEEVDDYVDSEADMLAGVADADAAADDVELLEDEDNENWQERIIELSRVTKVVKGGKLMGFRCTAIVGNGKGLVGVGCQSGREVATAVKRALVDAKKSVVRVPLVGAGTIPHRVEAKFHAARCVIVPAADGTGCLAGGAIRSVLELAGVQNVLGKRIGCRSPLNNARCTVAALEQLRTLQDVSKARGVPMDRLLLPQ